MADNRYRPKSPPRSRGYADPRASSGMVYSSSFDPSYPSQPKTTLAPYSQARHGSIYDTQAVKRRTYVDDARPGSTISKTEYAVRPRNNSFIPSESRRPLSTVVRNTPPTAGRPVVSGSSRDDPRSAIVESFHGRDDPGRYLVPATSQGREHHQRHYSATRVDIERLNPDRRGSRPLSEYHSTGGYSQRAYPAGRAPLADEGFSYTGPREQFDRDYPPGPPHRRDDYVARERPVSVMEIPEHKPLPPIRRDPVPPSSSARPFDRFERGDPGRLNPPSGFDADLERPDDIPRRRHSMRQPVLHQYRDEGYSSARDEYDHREPPKSRRERLDDDDRPVKLRPRDFDRDFERDRERDRGAPREQDRERERLRPQERPPRYPEERREARSRETSPERSGISKGIAAAGVGSLAAATLAGAAVKGSRHVDDPSENDNPRERRHRKHRHKDRADDDTVNQNIEVPTSRRAPAVPTDTRRPSAPKRDESDSETGDEHHEKRRHRRRKHRDRDEREVGLEGDAAATTDTLRPEPLVGDPEDLDKSRHRRDWAQPRSREPDLPVLEQRTMSPGEAEDERPRRVQLVEPVKDNQESKPKGILKPARQVPFPEDPNPTREGVAPLKDAGKDGVPAGARWTKISRMLVNPEALEKSQERFEEREDYVIVLRVVTREEIQKLAEKTREIRKAREHEWQEELERRKGQNSDRHRDRDDNSDFQEEEPRPPLAIDQKPAAPGIDPRSFTNQDANAVPMPQATPIPNIKLESVDTSNYSNNV